MYNGYIVGKYRTTYFVKEGQYGKKRKKTNVKDEKISYFTELKVLYLYEKIK